MSSAVNKNFILCSSFSGNYRLSGKQVGSRASSHYQLLSGGWPGSNLFAKL